MAKKIFFGNYKGGVGKTTSCFQIAINMAIKHNKKVLMLDLDPQASLSRICMRMFNTQLQDVNIEKTFNYLLELYLTKYRRLTREDILENKDVDQSIASLLIDEAIFTKQYIGMDGSLSIIPSRMDVVNARINDIAERISRYSMGIIGVAKLVEKLEDKFDYIIIDCPPSINTIIQSVFLKSDFFVIPTIADEISSDGVIDYIKLIEQTTAKFTHDSAVGSILIEKVFSKPPVLLGVLQTMAKTRSQDSEYTVLSNLNSQLEDASIISIAKYKDFYIQNFSNDDSVSSDEKHYIFKEKIPYLSNRTSASYEFGVPQKTIDCESHSAYDNITSQIIEICENL